MTLQEAKDQVAIKHRFKDWEDVVLQFQAKNYVDEVSELYARSKWDEAATLTNRNIVCRTNLSVIDLPAKPEFKP